MNADMQRRAALDVGHRGTIGSTMLISPNGTGSCRSPLILTATLTCALFVLSACSTSEVAWMEDTPVSFMASALAVSETPGGDTDTVLSEDQSPEDALLDGDDTQMAKAAPAPRARPAGRTQGTGRDIRPAIAHPSTSPTHGRKGLNPNKLVGLDEREVIRLLGQPERVRSKPPATVWSYTVKKCSLDVFFYLDLASERFRVLAYEVNSTRNSEEMKRVCLGRIQSALRTN